MKFLIITVVILLSGTAFGSNIDRFLICDYDETASEYIVEINGTALEAVAPLEIRGQTTIIMDLDGYLAPGILFTIRAKAVNSWGDQSEWSVPLEFSGSGDGIIITRQQPEAPNLLRVLTE